MIFYASCPINHSDLVAEEARLSGGKDVKIFSSGVEFSGSVETGMRFCMYSRAASRLLLALFIDTFINSSDDLYEASLLIPWENYLGADNTIRIGCTEDGSSWVKNTHYAALKVKDAICDRIREKFNGERPQVDLLNPDITFHIHISGSTVKWYVDFSGDSLYERGYREEGSDAVMKEHLAAALLLRSDWRKNVTLPLLDPFCGSGTIAIEAALLASDTAPGLIRSRLYAFERLWLFDSALWEAIWGEAEERRDRALKERDIKIYASDISEKALNASVKAAQKAKVSSLISFSLRDFFSYEEGEIAAKGHIVTDPPYGVRMKIEDTASFYSMIGDTLERSFKGWKCTILSSDKESLSNIDMKADKFNTLYSGSLQVTAAHYVVFTDEERKESERKSLERKRERMEKPLSDEANSLFKKLSKNLSSLLPIMRKENVSSFRIYDSSLPEYPASIDFYEGRWVTITLFAPPREIDKETAERHKNELILVTERVTGVDESNIYLKEKKRMKKGEQYTKLSSKNRFNIMRENSLIYLVNFQDYHDTGVFLDHRKTRLMIQKLSSKKRFLNLYSYTATATLNAVKGGSLSTVSVDTSSTYLDWAMENLKINGFSTGLENFFYKEDAIDYLWRTYDKFDLIFCDPPTFSNGKGRSYFSVEKDHARLIKAAAMHLAPGGILIFSTNFRGFKMSDEILKNYSVKDITEETIGEDYKESGNIHKCYLIRNKIKIKRNS